MIDRNASVNYKKVKFLAQFGVGIEYIPDTTANRTMMREPLVHLHQPPIPFFNSSHWLVKQIKIEINYESRMLLELSQRAVWIAVRWVWAPTQQTRRTDVVRLNRSMSHRLSACRLSQIAFDNQNTQYIIYRNSCGWLTKRKLREIGYILEDGSTTQESIGRRETIDNKTSKRQQRHQSSISMLARCWCRHRRHRWSWWESSGRSNAHICCIDWRHKQTRFNSFCNRRQHCISLTNIHK